MMTSQAQTGYSRRQASGSAVSAAAVSRASDACGGPTRIRRPATGRTAWAAMAALMSAPIAAGPPSGRKTVWVRLRCAIS